MKRVLVFLGTITALLLSLGPVAWLLSAALKPTSEIINNPTQFLPIRPTLENIFRVINETRFLKGLHNSLFVAIPVTIIVSFLAFFLAYTAAHSPRRVGRMLQGLAVAGYVFPPILLALPMFVLFSRVGLTGSLWALAYAHASFLLPFAFWLLHQRLADVPRSLEESMQLDGADIVSVLVHVWIPKFRIHITSVAVLVFTVSMNDYVLARFVVGGGSETLPLVLQAIFDHPSSDWGMICASGAFATISLTLPVLLINLLSGENYTGGQRG